MFRLTLALALAAVAACAPPRAPASAPAGAHAAAPPARLADAELTLTHGDARIGTYVSKPWGFDTRTYWIEGPTGLVLIDTQFLPSAAEEALAWAEAATGKKVELAIVLHPNPDKFNGTGVLRRRGVKVVTSEQVRALIPHVFEERTRAFKPRYAPDWPETLALPDAFGSATRELTAGGVTVKAHVLGAGCSDAHVVVEFDGHLFPGDLVTNGAHAWLELGRLEDWAKRLDEMKALEPRFVHPGRGPSGGAGLLDAQAAYLQRVDQIARAERSVDRAKEKLVGAYPGYAYEVFLDIGLPAVVDRKK